MHLRTKSITQEGIYCLWSLQKETFNFVCEQSLIYLPKNTKSLAHNCEFCQSRHKRASEMTIMPLLGAVMQK